MMDWSALLRMPMTVLLILAVVFALITLVQLVALRQRLHGGHRLAASWRALLCLAAFALTLLLAGAGYALRGYERYARIRPTKDGRWRVSNPGVAQQYRLNVGTIVEAPMLNIRYVRSGRGASAWGGPVLGKIEEYFIETLTPGDTFLFAGKVLRFEGIRENECFVSNRARLKILAWV